MTKPVSVAAVIAGALALLSGTARAELPNASEVTFEELEIHEDGGSFQQPSTPEALREYLNMAHCVCSQANAGMETSLRYLVGATADTNTDKAVELWVGRDCGDTQLRATQCRPIDTLPNIDLLVTSPDRVEFSFYDVMTGFDAAAPCEQVEGEKFLWALVDADGDGTYDYTKSQSVGVTMDVTRIDTKPPPAPTEFVGASAENAVRLSWTPDPSMSDIYGYQVLCAKSDGTPALASTSLSPRYTRVVDLCGLESDSILVNSTPLESSDETASTIPDAMAKLDPSFLCGETLDATATGILIEGLDNDVPYSVVVVTIDQYGNAVGDALDKTITPRIAFDFWEDLHNRGSNVEGGFCLAGTTTPGGTAGPLALALGFLLVRRRRPRGGRALARLVPVVTLVVVIGAIAMPNTAHAQGTTPYWEEQQEDEASLDTEALVRWHVGLRLGPYTPDIDHQFGMDPGPYHEMFGGYQVLPMLDIDRIIWRGVGQLGIGGSIGYMQKTANAWADANPGPDRMRSAGDENTFRLWPLAATVVYRFTWLDDNYGIPVVPYVRGGLSYYVWWFKTNGDTSKACWDGTSTPDCDADKAYGATLGVQGSIGVAIRAERIDSAAATSMRAGGIEHAGFYGELSLAKVDGFGSEYKLSVGDATWFAGVNFEF